MTIASLKARKARRYFERELRLSAIRRLMDENETALQRLQAQQSAPCPMCLEKWGPTSQHEDVSTP